MERRRRAPLARDVRADRGETRLGLSDIVARSGASFGVYGAQKCARLFSHFWAQSEFIDKGFLDLGHRALDSVSVRSHSL